MSVFEVGPAMSVGAGDRWATRVFVDPSDWSDSTRAERRVFESGIRRRYVDGQGNSAVDVAEVWGEGRLLSTVELHDPPRRTGPESGAERARPTYRRGRDDG